MIRLSIRRKIIGIALVLIVLMTITALLSLALVVQVSGRLEDLTQSYVPAYGDLARANIRTLERAVALRRMVIEKMQSPPDNERFAEIRASFEKSAAAVGAETQAATARLDALIAKGSNFGDTAALARLETRLADLMGDTHRRLDVEIKSLLPLLAGTARTPTSSSPAGARGSCWDRC